MRSLNNASILVLLTSFLTSPSCAKKSNSNNSEGTPTESAAPAGTIAIETVETEKDSGSTPEKEKPLPEATTEEEILLTQSMNQQIPLRPSIMVGTVALSLLEKTAFDDFEEGRYVWNPANIPLEELNKIVCVLAKTGFHINKDRGKYVARIKLDDCFSMANVPVGQTTSAEVVVPSDVIVETAVRDNGAIDMRVWFTREIEGRRNSAMKEVFIWENFKKLDLDYFVEASFTEIPTNENPFGAFDIKWEMLIKKDGVRDLKPFQQGFVNTVKSNDRITLNYNQRNWNFDDQACSARASAKHAGMSFIANQSGADLNGSTMIFDGSKNVQQTISDSVLSVGFDHMSIDSIVLPAMTLTFAGGTAGTIASAIYDNITFTFPSNHNVNVTSGTTVEALLNANFNLTYVGTVDLQQILTPGTVNLTGYTPADYSRTSYNGIEFMIVPMSDTHNGRSLVFDGTKTIGKVIEDYEKQHSVRPSASTNLSQMILPAGTVTFNGGVAEQRANVNVSTPDGSVYIEANMSGTELNNFRVCFDGIKNVTATVQNIVMPVMGLSLIVPSNGERVPLAGCVTLSGGSGPPKDTWASIREFSASAMMDLSSGKPVRGKAHTAENWSRSNITNICPSKVPSWTPTPVSYGLVFDRFDTYPNKAEPTDVKARSKYPGRAVAKQFNDFRASTAATGFDPSAARCEQMGGEMANVWNYALFDERGKKINHRTYMPLFVENSTNEWGDGWVSEWGTSLWGQNNASRVYIKNEDGTKRFFDTVKFEGILRNDTGASHLFAKTSGIDRFNCVDFCPTGTIDQTVLDNRWDPSRFLYNQEYVFDYTSKRLYRDINKDGSMDELVEIADSIQGYFEIRLTLKGDSTKSFSYAMDTNYVTIGLKEGNVFFTPPKRLEFDKAQVYDPALHAYPGSETMNAAHNGRTFAELVSRSFSYDQGNLCCLDWEPKAGLSDQWGNTAQGAKVTFKKGATLKLDLAAGDPDGDGPLVAGMKVVVAPAFSELRPINKNDCSVDSTSALDNIQTDLPLPAPLADPEARRVRQRLGERPSGKLPVLIINGESI